MGMGGWVGGGSSIVRNVTTHVQHSHHFHFHRRMNYHIFVTATAQVFPLRQHPIALLFYYIFVDAKQH